MGKRATKAGSNIFYIARYEASKTRAVFESREKTAEETGIDRTRLARIELGEITPYPEEVLLLANAYGSPELCNKFCANDCPIGQHTVQELNIDEFDRLALKTLGSLKDIDNIRARLINIAEDGVISPDEYDDFQSVLSDLEKISASSQALHLWASKYIDSFNIIKAKKQPL